MSGQLTREHFRDVSDAELLQLSRRGLDEIDYAIVHECPIVPHPRQREFLELEDEEVLYGGAVGGAKTEAGMIWLAEGVRHRNYSGLFIRRTASMLKGTPTAPIERSHKFFAPMGGKLAGMVWTFPNGAQIAFDSMHLEQHKHKFDGHEYHRVFVDQVEQLTESQYTYLFSRVRRTVDMDLPCGIRASANPVGGHWVRNRFVSEEAISALKGYTAYDPSPRGMVFSCPGTDGKFLPSRIADNPSLRVKEYIERLRSRLGAVLAAKLANGDWSAIEGAVIDPESVKYYTTNNRDTIAVIGDRRVVIKVSQRFVTIDTAGTSKQKAAESKGKNPSWSVAMLWEHDKTLGLFLKDVWRARVGWPDLKVEVRRKLRQWGDPRAIIENAHHGQVLKAELNNSQLVNPSIAGMKHSDAGAKYDRAVASGLLGMVSDGRFWLPDVATVEGAAAWMPEFEGELYSWTGHPDETADQIDTCSYASNHVKSRTRTWSGVVKPTRMGLQRRL